MYGTINILSVLVVIAEMIRTTFKTKRLKMNTAKNIKITKELEHHMILTRDGVG